MKSNLSKRDLNLILIALSIVLVAVVIFMYYLAYTSEADELDLASDALRLQINDLRHHEAMLPLYVDTLTETAAFVEQELTVYRSWIETSDLIMYAVNLEGKLTAVAPAISSVAFTEPTLIHSAYFTDTDGVYTNIDFYSIGMSLNARMSYEEMKAVIAEICSADDRTLLETMSLTYDTEKGLLNVTLTLKKVFLPLNGTNPAYIPIPSGPLGTQNPFGVVNTPIVAAPESVDEGIE